MDEQKNDRTLDFDTYWSSIRTCFGDPCSYTTRSNKLRELRITDNLLNYIDSFYDLSHQCGWSDIALCQQFRSQLKPWLHQKLIGYEESNLEELINRTLLVDRQSQLCRAVRLNHTTPNFQPKRDQKDWRDSSQLFPNNRSCTFCKREGHTQDFCYSQKDAQATKTNKQDIKISELSFPLDGVTHHDDQEEVLDFQRFEDDHQMSDITQREEETDTNLSIYGIREEIQRDNDNHIRGNRKSQSWTLRLEGEDNKYNKILFREQDGRFFLYLTLEVANETKMERVLVDTRATASILSNDYIQHIKTDTKSKALMHDGTRTTIYKTESRVYLHIGSKKQSWEFRVSETSIDIILGMDWIEQNIYNISFADLTIIICRKTFDDEPRKEIPELEEILKKFKLFLMSKNIYLHIALTIANLYSNLMLKNSNNTR
jgi:uncharacterized RmlC-like cupin family protein